jgi:hypothetical protein
MHGRRVRARTVDGTPIPGDHAVGRTAGSDATVRLTVLVNDDFVAVGTATDLRSHATELRRRWETSLGLGRPRGVRSVIADSWTRMLGEGIEPDRLEPTRVLDEDGLAAAREACPLGTVLDDLRGCLGGLTEDAEHILVVGDAAGRLLWIEGHERVLDQARTIDFVPGMSWVESSAGTNAIGTALAIDHAVQIFSAEHFLTEQHPWWCSAAPIHDPMTGALVGVVDLSGPQRTAHPHSLWLVTAAAAMAEQSLRNRAEVADARRAEAHDDRPRYRPASVPRDRGRLQLLASHDPVFEVSGFGRCRLSPRQAEALALLALHPAGLTAEQLTVHLYGDDGNPVTTRALLSRLRESLGDLVDTRPYRLAEGITVDLHLVRRLLLAGEGRKALAMYSGPLLETSEVPTIRAAREEIDLAVRDVAMRGGPNELWRWLDTPTGQGDLAAVERFLRYAPEDDPRRPLARSRRTAIQDAWAD